jgi:tRNA threonylcarbamoyladenosine biosynthesis protein TsaB
MLLAVDTSTQWTGLALYEENQVVGEMVWNTRNHHTVEMAPAIRSLLNRCGVEAQELKALAVALGPGSFTSLRIGLAVVKGMALALHLPVIGIPTLDFLAAAQPGSSDPLACILRAGRGRFAMQWYAYSKNNWRVEGELQVIEKASLHEHFPPQKALVTGELTAVERQNLARKCRQIELADPARSVRRPSYLAQLAWSRFEARQFDDVVSLAPIYLHVVPGSVPAEA